MAKFYDIARANLNVALLRQFNTPLDVSEVFYNLDDFKAYVRQDEAYAPAGYEESDIAFLQKINARSYAGQVVAVVVNDKATLYVIDKVGGDVEGTNFSAIGGDVAADLSELTGKVNQIQSTVNAIPSTYQTKAIGAVSGLSASTVEGALNELGSITISHTNYINNHQVSFDSLANNINSVDSRVSTIEKNYALKEDVNDAVSSIEGTISGLTSVYASITRVDRIETRVSEVENAVSNLTGAFQFQGTANTVEDLPAANASIKGHVYIVGTMEYVCDGTKWIQLGDEGSYVLKTTYNSHLDAQASVDKGQNTKISALEASIAAIQDFDAVKAITSADVTKWNNAQANAIASASALVTAEASRAKGVEGELSSAIGAEVSRAIVAEASLSERITTLENIDHSVYAHTSTVNAQIAEVSAKITEVENAATKVEKSETNGNIKVDGTEVVVYNDKALADRIGVNEKSIAENASAIASNTQLFTDLQGTVASISTDVTNLQASVKSNTDGINTLKNRVEVEYIALTNSSGTLTAEQFGKVNKKENKEIIFALDGGKYFFQLAGDNSDGDLVYTAVLDNTLMEIVIDPADYSWAYRTTKLAEASAVASKPVVNIAGGSNELSISYFGGATSTINLTEVIFGTSQLASNAANLLSSTDVVDQLTGWAPNASKAVTSVSTESLAISKAGHLLEINLPSELILDGGNAKGYTA